MITTITAPAVAAITTTLTLIAPAPATSATQELATSISVTTATVQTTIGAVLQGPKGDQGDQGVQGPAGPQGEQGPQGLQGIQGIEGPQGDPGANGQSAYEAWLALGNVGTEADFIASLEGAQGPAGTQGPQGVQGDQGPIGPQGPQGIQGEQGNQGPQGDPGPGLPAGGAEGALPRKASSTDYDVEWSGVIVDSQDRMIAAKAGIGVGAHDYSLLNIAGTMTLDATFSAFAGVNKARGAAHLDVGLDVPAAIVAAAALSAKATVTGSGALPFVSGMVFEVSNNNSPAGGWGAILWQWVQQPTVLATRHTRQAGAGGLGNWLVNISAGAPVLNGDTTTRYYNQFGASPIPIGEGIPRPVGLHVGKMVGTDCGCGVLLDNQSHLGVGLVGTGAGGGIGFGIRTDYITSPSAPIPPKATIEHDGTDIVLDGKDGAIKVVTKLKAAADLEVAQGITQQPLSADPADPPEGASVTWVSDGTGTGDAGELWCKITTGAVTYTRKLADRHGVAVPASITQAEHDHGNLGTAITLDVAQGNKQRGMVNDDLTITLPAAPADAAFIRLRLKNSGAGHSITIVGASPVGGVAPTLDDADDAGNVLVFDGSPFGWIYDGASA